MIRVLTFNLLRLNIIQITSKNLTRIAKKTLHFTITKINWLMLFKEMMAVYSENHTIFIRLQCEVKQVVCIVNAGI